MVQRRPAQGHWGLNIEGFWQEVNTLTSTLSPSFVVCYLINVKNVKWHKLVSLLI